jgi:diguanylate cyclase (GGDEF)-like protein
MTVSARTRTFLGYLLLLALLGTVSWLVLSYGRQVQREADALMRERLPLLAHVSSLRSDLLGREAVLYEYYATGDRSRYLGRIGPLERFCAASVGVLKETMAHGVDAIDADNREIGRLAGSLDAVMSTAPVDWDQARVLLAEISARTRAAERELERVADRLRAETMTGAMDTQREAERTSLYVLLLMALLLVLALFAGWYVHAYLAEEKERRKLAIFPERNPSPVMRLSRDGGVFYSNPATRKLLEVLGRPDNQPQLLLPGDYVERLERMVAESRRHELWEYSLAGHYLECGVNWLDDLDMFHLYVYDVTERKKAEEKLVFQAYHDTLTGLPNRRLLNEQCERLLPVLHSRGRRAALLLMGLDRLRVIIGSLGHDMGDRVMKAVAERLASVLTDCGEFCRESGLYRLEGGQLFAYFLPNLTDEHAPLMFAERVQEAMRQPFFVEGREFAFSLSIGIALFPQDGEDSHTLLRNADSAMQRAKLAGGGRLACYTADMNSRALEWLKLENHLRHAIELDELELQYQPQYEIESGRLVGMEALLRWRHPEHDLISPLSFIPLAEESGIIMEIGEWALRRACYECAEWLKAGYPLLVAVNLSARQFRRPDLTEWIAAILEETGLPAKNLELEITESVAMGDLERAVATLSGLKSLGLKLAIDDFGTGFSSMAYLQRFPLDKLKIDQSFVRHIVDDANDAAICQAIITLGHNLGLRVIAEGVENEAQLERLRAQGCDEMQGYFHSPPLNAEAFAAMLGKQVSPGLRLVSRNAGVP